MDASDTISVVSNDSNESNDNNNPYKLITRRIDAMKVRNNHKREIEVNITQCIDLNFVQTAPVRAGAIIYTKIETKTRYPTRTQTRNQTFFCLGIDTQSGNLTDFGGGVKKGETIVEGGLRELEEESEGVFGHIDPSEVSDATAFHSYNMTIMFIEKKLDQSDIERISTNFRTNVKDNEEPEVCNIIWLTKEEFLDSIDGRGKKLYVRVRRLLNKVTDSISEM